MHGIRIAVTHRHFNLVDFFFDLAERALPAGPMKPTLPALLPSFCARTRAGPSGTPSRTRFARGFSDSLNLVPLREDLVGGIDAGRVGEHVRVTSEMLVTTSSMVNAPCAT